MSAVRLVLACLYPVWRQLSVGSEGRAPTGSRLQFLVNVNTGVKEVPGQRVLVMGRGSVALNVGSSGLRLGSEEVSLEYLECCEDTIEDVGEEV
jgi:hypothetical protein